MDIALAHIAEIDNFDFTRHEPQRDMSLKEFVFMVGFTRVAQDTYPGDTLESACDKLQAALTNGSVLKSNVTATVTKPKTAVVSVVASAPCGSCGGGRVR